MASSTSDEIIRLFKCYVETVTDVMKVVVDEKLLQLNHWTLQQYLEDKKHLFYHQTGTFKNPTCDCPPAGCSLLKRTHTINQKVFYSLYDSTANVEKGHEFKKNGRVEQTCIHKYVPKNIGIDDLDIGTMCFMLTITATLSQNEMSSVTMIRNYRNDVCHIWSKNHYSALSVNKMWTELESSLLTLTCKPYVQRMVKAGFLQHKNYVISTEDISDILEKMSTVTEDVNQLPSRSDFDNFKNVCLHRNNTMQAAICARISEETKTVREDIGRNTEKILQAIGNATFSTNYPKHKLVPVPQNDCKLQGEGKVLWHIETPDNWDLENVEATVKDNTQLEEQPIKIKFVKTGSLYLLTTVPQSILNSPANFEMAVKSFLESLVDICKFDTSMPCHVEVDLSFLEEGNDTIRVGMVDTNYQPTSNQQESRSITSISTQTDLIDIRCPKCDNTIEFNFEGLDVRRKTKPRDLQQKSATLLDLQQKSATLLDVRRKTKPRDVRRKTKPRDLQQKTTKLLGEQKKNLDLAHLQQESATLLDLQQKSATLLDLQQKSTTLLNLQQESATLLDVLRKTKLRDTKHLRLTLDDDEKQSFSHPKGTEKKTESIKDDIEGIRDHSYLFSKHSLGIPKGTKRKIESTKDDQEGILDTSYLFPESSLSYGNRTEKKTISTTENKGVLDSEDIFTAKKQGQKTKTSSFTTQSIVS